ncbi:uncharacterized protein WM277_019274 isoform 1-T2 [Molossus nigricans]
MGACELTSQHWWAHLWNNSTKQEGTGGRGPSSPPASGPRTPVSCSVCRLLLDLCLGRREQTGLQPLKRIPMLRKLESSERGLPAPSLPLRPALGHSVEGGPRPASRDFRRLGAPIR